METIKSRLKNDIDYIRELRENGMLIKDIADIYNIKEKTMGVFLSDNGILWRKPLTQDDYSTIVNRYQNGDAIYIIARDFHVASNKITNILKERGIKIRTSSEFNRKYELDQTYFDVIDTPNKAYIIGLLIADGNIHKKHGSVRLQLSSSDVGVLEAIRNEIGSTRPLRFVEVSRINPAYSDSYLLEFASAHMIEELGKYHITQNKDFTTKFPTNIDSSLYRHVIRGILDGDGSILKTERRCSITGNDELIDFLVDYIESTLNIHCSCYYEHHSDKTKCLRISGGRQVKKFLDYIYEDAELYIQRKYDLYQQLYCA